MSECYVSESFGATVCCCGLYLCRQGACCSTVTGVRGCSRWRRRPAARGQSGRRRSTFLLPGKRPFQSSARWWRQRRGSCTARTSQLRGRTISCVTENNRMHLFQQVELEILHVVCISNNRGFSLHAFMFQTHEVTMTLTLTTEL